MLMLLTHRTVIRSLLGLAAMCALAAVVIGPGRALILFVFVVALGAVTVGGLFAVMYFFSPDSNGDNWFSARDRRQDLEARRVSEDQERAAAVQASRRMIARGERPGFRLATPTTAPGRSRACRASG